MQPVYSDKTETRPWTFFTLIGLIVFLYAIELVDVLLPLSLDAFGIHPRSLFGLVGILFSPFLHADFSHLLSNTMPLLVLGFIVLKAEKLHFVTASLNIMFWGGLGTWLIGNSNAIHVGASGVIYGYFGYVLTRGVMERRAGWIVVSLLTLFFFGGMIYGVLPTQNAISWEGHLCGLLAGIWVARKRVNRNKRDAQQLPIF